MVLEHCALESGSPFSFAIIASIETASIGHKQVIAPFRSSEKPLDKRVWLSLFTMFSSVLGRSLSINAFENFIKMCSVGKTKSIANIGNVFVTAD